MNLQELLQSYQLSEEQIKQINSTIDSLIAAKVAEKVDAAVAEKDAEIEKLNGDVKSVSEELAPHKEKANADRIKSLVGDLTSEDKIDDAVALAGLTEEDDDETIKSKVKSVIEARPHLQSNDDVVDNKVVTKTENENPNAGAEEKPEVSTTMGRK